jgi:post-segregation antitoxin (ccd killing protein)
MDTTLTIRIPVETAQVLAERKQNHALNISAFVRRAIERELARPIADAEPERHAPVLFTPKRETR